MAPNSRYRCLLASGLVTLAACSLPPPLAPVQPLGTSASAQTGAPTTQAAKIYQIDSAASMLHIRVYRGGAMARLGHNHVISSHDISGRIWRGKSLKDSGFAITVPVNTLIVDDNAARAAEGADFPLNLTEDAKQSTRANMLRDTLLDGARYPDISIQSVSLEGDAYAPWVLAVMRIKDQTRQVKLPVTVQSNRDSLHIRGEFDINQTDFGITPLSVAMGALRVLDTIKIRFELVAKSE